MVRRVHRQRNTHPVTAGWFLTQPNKESIHRQAVNKESPVTARTQALESLRKGNRNVCHVIPVKTHQA